MEPDTANTTNRLVQQMRGLSVSSTHNTPSPEQDVESASPLSPRALRRPQRPRAQPGTRPKSMISLSSYPYPPRGSKKTTRNLDDMDVDTIDTPCFIETLIQEIQDAPVQLDQPPATDQQPRQNKRWSVHAPPLEIYFREEDEVTPEQEKAAIARYRREKFSIPEHEWWKLESKHRIAVAALRRMEDDEAMDENQSELPSPVSNKTPFVHKNGGLESKSALRPEVQEAIGFSHTPDPQAVRPVGENGLDLENPTQVAPSLARPPDCNPEAWEHWQHLDGVTDYQRHAYIGARLSAYSFENGDIFNIQDSRVRQRLHHVEKCWQQGKAAMNIETQFWNAVYERQYQPNDFSHRDAYLLLANAVEFAANMLVYGRSEIEIHRQKFNRYLTTAFDCPKEDQDGSSLDIPELSNTLLRFVPRPKKSLAQGKDSLHDTTERLGSLHVG